MRSERMFRLGLVKIDGDLIEFEPERTLEFAGSRRDLVSVGIQYDYREVTEDRERAAIRLTAHVDGEPSQSAIADIGDNPLLDDSRRGFLSVPVRVGRSGELRGRFVVEADYSASPWTKPSLAIGSRGRHEGTFTLRIE